MEQALYSYELHCFFENPGLDSIKFEPNKRFVKTYYEGRPLAISLWVYGMNKRHKLFAVFTNYTKHKYLVPISSLDFTGWNRLYAKIPSYIQRRNPRRETRYDFTFKGFIIKSHKAEDSGLFLFTYDQVMLLIDTSEETYPGSDIKDKF